MKRFSFSATTYFMGLCLWALLSNLLLFPAFAEPVSVPPKTDAAIVIDRIKTENKNELIFAVALVNKGSNPISLQTDFSDIVNYTMQGPDALRNFNWNEAHPSTFAKSNYIIPSGDKKVLRVFRHDLARFPSADSGQAAVTAYVSGFPPLKQTFSLKKPGILDKILETFFGPEDSGANEKTVSSPNGLGEAVPPAVDRYRLPETAGPNMSQPENEGLPVEQDASIRIGQQNIQDGSSPAAAEQAVSQNPPAAPENSPASSPQQGTGFVGGVSSGNESIPGIPSPPIPVPGISAPIVTGVSVSSSELIPSTVAILWETDVPSDSLVACSGGTGAQGPDGMVQHKIFLQNLLPNTSYDCQAFSKNDGGMSAPATFHFTTYTDDPKTLHFRNETIPNFAFHPTIKSRGTGSWFDVSIWVDESGNPVSRIPNAYDRVLIPHGSTVAINGTGAQALAVNVSGVLHFLSDVNTSLHTANILVMGDGILRMGMLSAPVQADRRAELVIRDEPMDPVLDPGAWGNGLLAFGSVTMNGLPKTPTFMRLSEEARAGDTVLQFQTSVSGWQAGDVLVLPDTRQLDLSNSVKQPGKEDRVPSQSHTEERTIAHVSDDGLSVALDQSLAFDHPGVSDANQNVRYFPHVANISRNVVIRSEDAGGKPYCQNGEFDNQSCTIRGHIAFMESADIKIYSSEFKNLGRTGIQPLAANNPSGRHAARFYGVNGEEVPPPNGYQYTFEGNAVNHSARWGVVIEASHFGLIRQNVVYDALGAGIVTVDGSETGNVIEKNISLGIKGSGEHPQNSPTRGGGKTDNGHEGSGFWFRGGNNYVRDNVAADVRRAGFSIFKYGMPGPVTFPLQQGIPPSVLGVTVNTANEDYRKQPLLQFKGNESYGAMANAIEIWWSDQTTLQDFTAWHIYDGALKPVYFRNGALQNFTALNDINQLTAPAALPSCAVCGNHTVAEAFTLDHAEISGFQTGIDVQSGALTAAPKETLFTVDHASLANRVDIQVNNWRVLEKPRRLVIRNTHFEPLPGILPKHIVMNWLLKPGGNEADHTVLDQTLVYNYNLSGENFQVFYPSQAPDFDMPQSTGDYSFRASPVKNLSNQENFSQYGIAVAGQVAPCSDTRPEIQGFVCSFGGSAPAMPQSPEKLVITWPVEGALLKTQAPVVAFTKTGVLGKGVREAVVEFDGGALTRRSASENLAGTFTVGPAAPGTHTLYGYLNDQSGNLVPGSDFSVSFQTE